MILVNKRIVSRSWTAIDIGSPDVTGIKISTTSSKVLIFNFYCNQEHSDAIRKANNFLQEYHRANNHHAANTEVIWLGDFNHHHPMWDDPKNSHLFTKHNLDEAQILLDALAEHNLCMALPKYVPTLMAMATHNYTRPDNMFTSFTLQDAVITCNANPEEQPAWTDHFPIDTTLAMQAH
jgi:exonuclease III